jgi:hypothetical protein
VNRISPLGEVYCILSQLQSLDRPDQIDWDALIGNHHYCDCIKGAVSALSDEADFEQYFSDFRAEITEPDGTEMPGDSFNWIDLYVAEESKEQINNRFLAFERHLKSLPRLQKAGIV